MCCSDVLPQTSPWPWVLTDSYYPEKSKNLEYPIPQLSMRQNLSQMELNVLLTNLYLKMKIKNIGLIPPCPRWGKHIQIYPQLRRGAVSAWRSKTPTPDIGSKVVWICMMPFPPMQEPLGILLLPLLGRHITAWRSSSYTPPKIQPHSRACKHTQTSLGIAGSQRSLWMLGAANLKPAATALLWASPQKQALRKTKHETFLRFEVQGWNIDSC